MITIRKATKHGIEVLGKKLLKLLTDTSSQLYLENVAKFGIPEAYVKKAFSGETLQKAVGSGKAVVYLALERREILGFAQTVRRDKSTVELDRIVVFPEYARKGIGTRLLARVLTDEQRKGTRTVIVTAGKEETHARRFYEKNGFIQLKESTVDAPWGSRLSLVTYQFELRS
ncbi:MAG TPA: GNAT family N-acetyltransferase [Candidatus Bathyarchaeia archaeon]|nr:GNAT family N-acetyltransferase [Candidatus Bathyarchaeia archaeon]